MASTSEKFDAAVSVIRNLPKNGPFQPSYDMMKRFYGLFKQATEGPCNTSKPGFWNVVQSQKWEAWSCLGTMESEEAKTLYVNELLKIILSNSKARDIPHLYQIIETMPQTEDVVGFLKIMGPFFELVSEGEAAKEEAVVTPEATKVNGHIGNGTVKMRDDSVSERGDGVVALTNGAEHEISAVPNGHMEVSEDHYQKDAEIKERLTVPTSELVGEEGEEEEGREKQFVLVESSKQNAAELSHPILVSKSQLEGVGEPPSASSDSESDGDEFCDSVDEPLMSKISVDHVSSLPSAIEEEEEEEEEKQLTSTPFNGVNAVVTRVEVHNDMDAVVVPHYTMSACSTPPQPSPSSRGGGNPPAGGSKGHQGQGQSRSLGQGSSQGHNNSPNRPVRGAQEGVDGSGQGGRRGGSGVGGTPGGNRAPGSPPESPLPVEVVEQITVSLERLQRDMNSVLVRLNTLETIAISRHQLETQQAYLKEGIPYPQGTGLPTTSAPPQARSASPSWWPFPTLPLRSVFILLVWPLIINWVIRFLARHRRARPPKR